MEGAEALPGGARPFELDGLTYQLDDVELLLDAGSDADRQVAISRWRVGGDSPVARIDATGASRALARRAPQTRRALSRLDKANGRSLPP